MQKNLEAYLKRIPKFLSPEVCDETIKDNEYSNWQEHHWANHYEKTASTNNAKGYKELDVSFAKPKTYDYIYDRIHSALYSYVKNLNLPWWGTVNGYTPLRFNKYSENTIMSEHCDHIYSIFDGTRKGIPTLTVLGMLNDEFEGGELVLWQDTVIPFEKGDLLIFPSIFLYPHRVEPVTKGVRHSFVSWVW